MPEPRLFEFEIGPDLHKLVTVHQFGQLLRVEVKYYDTVVREQNEETFRITGAPEFEQQQARLAIRWRAPLTKWTPWPTITRSRYF